MADNLTLPAFGETLAADDIGGVKHQRMKIGFGADGSFTDASSANPVPVEMASAPLPTGAATETTLSALNAKIPASPAQDRTAANAPSSVRLSDGAAFISPATESTALLSLAELVSIDSKIPSSPSQDRTASNAPSSTRLSNGSAFLSDFEAAFGESAQRYSVAGVIAINTVLLTLDLKAHQSVIIQCSSMGTTGVVTPEWSQDNATWVGARFWTSAGVDATTFNAAGMWAVPRMARYLRLRLSTATTAGTTTIDAAAIPTPFMPWYATQPVSGTVNANATAVASNVRMGYVGAAGIWYDDSSTALIAAATFTGTSRDLTGVAASTAFNVATSYAAKLTVSAESDVTGTLWLEVSRDNTNWRRVKSVATAAVTGGGFYAEIDHVPSWRYARVGYTNGAGAQARFSIGTILKAV